MAQDLTTPQTYLQHLTDTSIAQQPHAPTLTMQTSGRFQVNYAPFDHIEVGAKLVIVGITPGLTQARAACAAAAAAQKAGATVEETLRFAKQTGAFAGAMRKNLTYMLDAIGLPQKLGLTSSVDLFSASSRLVHFTSALRYPVFYDGGNYSGTPSMLRQPVLRAMIERYLAEEARLLPNALWLPLGPKPTAALMHLVKLGLLDENQILAGLPHPSPANNERIAVFLGRKTDAAASDRTDPAALHSAYNKLRTLIDPLAL